MSGRVIEDRVVCDPLLLEQAVRLNLGSDATFAAYLGVGEETARRYRLGRVTLPRSFFEKLRTLSPALQAVKTTDAFWGQRKGGRLRTVRGKSSNLDSDCNCASFDPREMDARSNSTFCLVPDDIGAYDVLSPSVTLEMALAEHREALAEFVGRIFGDGSPMIAPTYSACEIQSQKRMQSLVQELFGFSPEIKVSKGNYRTQLRRQCGHTLRLLGIPFGRKSVTNPSVPTFIMKSNEPTVWRFFLRGLFDDEAYVSPRGIEIGLAVRQAVAGLVPDNLTGSRILDDVSKLLCRLHVQHVRRRGQIYEVGDARAICWFLRIPRREFRKVYELGLFLLTEKRRRLIAPA